MRELATPLSASATTLSGGVLRGYSSKMRIQLQATTRFVCYHQLKSEGFRVWFKPPPLRPERFRVWLNPSRGVS